MMPCRYCSTSKLRAAILGIIQTAQRELVLVSPYNKFTGNLRDEIWLALKRGVNVVAIVREGSDSEAADWLSDLGVTVLSVPNLHAKIYRNESSAILASMNLLEYSMANSKEFAVVVTDAADLNIVTAYIDRLRDLAIEDEEEEDDDAGSCIRCGNEIEYDPDHPLCDACFKSWRRYSNPEYSERFCHDCGNERATSYAKPLCHICFTALV